jgi:hypothetical protein
LTRTRLPTPYDQYCKRLASDMSELDSHWAESPEHLAMFSEDAKREERVSYIRHEEGTYNPDNGHFACDSCYTALGMPSTSTGWKAP